MKDQPSLSPDMARLEKLLSDLVDDSIDPHQRLGRATWTLAFILSGHDFDKADLLLAEVDKRVNRALK